MSEKIFLRYSQIVCLGCGAKRVRGLVCADCGAIPDEREVDPDRQRRRKCVERLLPKVTAIAGREDQRVAAPPDAIWSFLSEWASGFITALAEAARSQAGEQLLETSVERFAALASDIEEAAPLRPWVSTWRALAAVIGELRLAVIGFLKAFAEEDPGQAQQAAAQGQDHLDRAGEPAARLAADQERWSRLESGDGDPGSFVPDLVAAIYESSGAKDPMTLDDAGRSMFAELTSQAPSAAPVGLGIEILTNELIANALLDRAGMFAKASLVYQKLASKETPLRDLVQSAEWTLEIQDGVAKTAQAGFLGQAALAQATKNHQVVVGLLSSFHSLFEGVGRKYIATVLAVVRGRSFLRLRFADAGMLTDQLRQDPDLASLAGGLDRALRLAFAHLDYEAAGSTVILRSRGKVLEKLTIEELLDRFLEGMESVLAFELGILCAAAHVGFPVANLSNLQALDLDLDDVVRLAASMFGLSNLEVEITESTITCEGTGEVTRRLMPIASTILSNADVGTRTLRLVGRLASSSHELSGPFDPIHEWQQADSEPERTVRFLETLRSWSLDGIPLAASEHSRKLLAISAGNALGLMSTDFVSGFKDLRTLLEAARRLNDDELADAIQALMGARRAQEFDLPATDRERERIDQLAEWLRLVVSDLE